MGSSGNPINRLLVRRNSNLSPLVIPPSDTSAPVESTTNQEVKSGLLYDKQQVQEEGLELFCNFLYDQTFEKQVTMMISNLSLWGVSQGYRHSSWAKNGENLKAVCNKFACSKKRIQVLNESLEFDLNMRKDQYMELLEHFTDKENITAERIVFIFFFCSDVILRCSEINRDIFRQYFEWTNEFLTHSISVWIYEHGGWGTVFPEPVNILARLIGFASVGVALLIIFKYLKYSYL
ncbi:apoptosis regulator BAX [Biomphalaria pfeifferi]|uniref:Apoptosis regulator BAX n=1 Tax=Biomphalaria pfeifferi TaxID=112525 RepID=A0AAD8EY09_BIOPF|nr:apoptosis regulator BAX [Biomphalaria pfeifferi]